MAFSVSRMGGAVQDMTTDLVGLSTDTKPTKADDDMDLANGSTFLEMDTGNVFFYDKANDEWVEPA